MTRGRILTPRDQLRQALESAVRDAGKAGLTRADARSAVIGWLLAEAGATDADWQRWLQDGRASADTDARAAGGGE